MLRKKIFDGQMNRVNHYLEKTSARSALNKSNIIGFVDIDCQTKLLLAFHSRLLSIVYL
jgi:hypothetical protein